ncbi:hypothetical protein SY83_13975 [Paenibacillus swuensis]|uniref:SPOR domain-containing protein n=1 Tax=Paenibacillus swuensis TaxID=1178515 RepID=A0A172TJF2_9BACL|nr:SpoIID/LytB domain-containing protein [Paenibacillus swuensis]ANE47189.1 hypothetical protein SY83_13975 [Paenibacillus swuensis]
MNRFGKRDKLAKWGMVAVVAAVITGGFTPIAGPSEAVAAIPKMSNIRVALLGDYTATYKNSVPAVTLSAVGGLQIGSREGTGIVPLSNTTDGKAVRFSLNSYGAQLLETADFAAAQALYKKISAAEMPALLGISKSGRQMYQVTVGPYANVQDATKAMSRLSGSSVLQGLLIPAETKLTGPLYASAGVYATESEAETQLAAVSGTGVDASVVIQTTPEGAAQYAVWFGRAADLTALEEAKAKVLSLGMPPETVSAADVSQPYLIKQTDLSSITTPGEGLTRYAIPTGGSKIWVSSAQPGITLKEKSNRIYRGAFELSQYNYKLAAVNELPMEQYLYGVVSAELGAGWPAEALKAQAVAARTYAVRKGTAYKIANISDTTLDQAYYGMKGEFPAALAGVEATAGEVITDVKGSLIEPLYYSNSGGKTADASEVWNNQLPYLHSVTSPDDGPQRSLPLWDRVITEEGRVGYIRADLLQASGDKNEAGLNLSVISSDNANLRNLPYVDDVNNPSIVKLSKGAKVVSLGRTSQSNPYQWLRGPYTPDQVAGYMKGKTTSPSPGIPHTLEVTKRGPSGRVTEMAANGQPVLVKYPDLYRTLFNSLPSTMFSVEETGRMTVLGAGGQTSERNGSGNALVVQSAAGATVVNNPYFVIMNGEQGVRAASLDARYLFAGNGYGHGLGMSQYGAKALAETGYDYSQILKYYYKDVSIVKE